MLMLAATYNVMGPSFGLYTFLPRARKDLSAPRLWCSLLLLSMQEGLVCHGDDALDDAMENALEEWNVRGPSIAVYIESSNRTEQPVVRGYGRVASSDDDSDRVSPDTTFYIASVSKVFAGAAVSVLLYQNAIGGLDDDICDVVLPAGWQLSTCRNPRFPDTPVTWRMLVTHRSSLFPGSPAVVDSSGTTIKADCGPEGTKFFEATYSGPTCPLEDVTGYYRDVLTDKETETSAGAGVTLQDGQELNWHQVARDAGGPWWNYEPGGAWSYSNFAFGYIAALVELRTGQSFADFTADSLFSPLKMNHTAWFRRDLPRNNMREALPVEYLGRNQWRHSGHYCLAYYAAGQLHTSAADLAKWCQAMLTFGSPTLWSDSVGNAAFQCQEKDERGNRIQSAWPDCKTGVAWDVLDNSMKAKRKPHWGLDNFASFDWTNGVTHAGNSFGFQSQVIVLPSAGVFTVVLTNTYDRETNAAPKITDTVMKAKGYYSSSGSSSVSSMELLLAGHIATAISICIIYIVM